MTDPQNPSQPPPKKKRNLPGMPDPDAEVVALSPKTLMATNRFVCEICNKGFQRDQNLQLHRRGHNLPWKLRQRGTQEVRKKVYVCPEAGCVHHSPSRALGDLTGIKKHFCRKHGDKKWKCDRCSKKYAVQSDWKAHMKTCGSREYRCDCGTLFSRRDSFVTHRAFCDALAEESARAQTKVAVAVASSSSSPPQPPPTPSTSVVSPTLSIQSSEMPENPTRLSSPPSSNITCLVNAVTTGTPPSSTNSSTVFASVLASPSSTSSFSNLMSSLARSDCATHSHTAISTMSVIEPTSLSLSTSSLYDSTPFPDQRYAVAASAALSATALLQKAAQMGAAASNASLLRGLGLATSSTSAQDDTATRMQWSDSHVKQENEQTLVDNLGLGLPCGNAALADVMMGSADPFGGQPMTRDLLGLSIRGNGGGGASRGSLSALLNSFGGNLDSSADGGVGL